MMYFYLVRWSGYEESERYFLLHDKYFSQEEFDQIFREKAHQELEKNLHREYSFISTSRIVEEVVKSLLVEGFYLPVYSGVLSYNDTCLDEKLFTPEMRRVAEEIEEQWEREFLSSAENEDIANASSFPPKSCWDRLTGLFGNLWRIVYNGTRRSTGSPG